MTDKQFEKLRLRLYQLLRERDIVQLVIVTMPDGLVKIQVNQDKVETLS